MSAVMTGDDNLVRSLHEGIFQSPLWEAFLAQLRARTGARRASIDFGQPGEGSALTLYSGEAASQADLPYLSMREGRVYSFEDLAELRGVKAGAAAIVGGLSRLRSVRVTEPGGVSIWLTCEGDNNLGAPVGALLSALVPHVRTALRTFEALERERMRSAVAAEAVERLRLGWIALDAKCTVLEASPPALEMFQWGTLLRKGRYDRLVPAAPAIDRRLTELVKSYAGGGDGKPQAFTLSQDPWYYMLVTPAPRRSVAAGQHPVAIAFVGGDRSSQADRSDQLVDLFGLLPSEARLAWVLAQASSIPEAAERLGITVETARNYSKKIYAKTGARGHAELVRVVLTSVMATG